MLDPIVLEITNGVVILLTSLILLAIRATFKWVRSVDKRLSRMEREINAGEKD